VCVLGGGLGLEPDKVPRAAAGRSMDKGMSLELRGVCVFWGGVSG